MLHTHGVSFGDLPQQEAWVYQQRWRECYCASMHALTGKWKDGDYGWNTFDRGYARCLRDSKALHAFLACPASEFLLILDSGKGWRCSASAMPDLASWPQECYVFPPDLEWTMVFSHEGPFFSRREWLPGNTV